MISIATSIITCIRFCTSKLQIRYAEHTAPVKNNRKKCVTRDAESSYAARPYVAAYAAASHMHIYMFGETKPFCGWEKCNI